MSPSPSRFPVSTFLSGSSARPASRNAASRNAARWSRLGACAVGLAALAACSDGPAGRHPNSEMAAGAGPARSRPAPSPASTSQPAPPSEPRAPSGRARAYRVVVETAYFFETPEEGTSTGSYLRRGDTFYGEGETNGFVKTAFLRPGGAPATGWRKVQELEKSGPAGLVPGGVFGGPAPRARAQVRPPVPPVLPAERPAEAVPAPVAVPGAVAVGAGRAVVQGGRAHFYDSPDLAVPRRAYCEPGDKVRLGETRGAAVYVTFTNWEKVTTTGWMRRADLRPIQ